ncbi:MAG: oxidoreductase, partial [Saccharofermentanales bacterium]
PVVVPTDFNFSKIIYIGSKIKESVEGLPVIVVGGIRTPDQADLVIRSGYGDFVAVGKGMLSDPDWTRKAYAPEMGLVKCLECRRCGWFDIGGNCPVRKDGML